MGFTPFFPSFLGVCRKTAAKPAAATPEAPYGGPSFHPAAAGEGASQQGRA
jgi:hypothetical protein